MLLESYSVISYASCKGLCHLQSRRTPAKDEIMRDNELLDSSPMKNPKSYLSFLSMYKEIYEKKYKLIDIEEQNINNGLDKLAEAEVMLRRVRAIGVIVHRDRPSVAPHAARVQRNPCSGSRLRRRWFG